VPERAADTPTCFSRGSSACCFASGSREHIVAVDGVRLDAAHEERSRSCRERRATRVAVGAAVDAGTSLAFAARLLIAGERRFGAR